jgi:hypothetical protein
MDGSQTAEDFESQRLRNAMRVYQRGYFKVYSVRSAPLLTVDRNAVLMLRSYRHGTLSP